MLLPCWFWWNSPRWKNIRDVYYLTKSSQFCSKIHLDVNNFFFKCQPNSSWFCPQLYIFLPFFSSNFDLNLHNFPKNLYIKPIIPRFYRKFEKYWVTFTKSPWFLPRSSYIYFHELDEKLRFLEKCLHIFKNFTPLSSRCLLDFIHFRNEPLHPWDPEQ